MGLASVVALTHFIVKPFGWRLHRQPHVFGGHSTGALGEVTGCFRIDGKDAGTLFSLPLATARLTIGVLSSRGYAFPRFFWKSSVTTGGPYGPEVKSLLAFRPSLMRQTHNMGRIVCFWCINCWQGILISFDPLSFFSWRKGFPLSPLCVNNTIIVFNFQNPFSWRTAGTVGVRWGCLCLPETSWAWCGFLHRFYIYKSSSNSLIVNCHDWTLYGFCFPSPSGSPAALLIILLKSSALLYFMLNAFRNGLSSPSLVSFNHHLVAWSVSLHAELWPQN